MTDQERNQEIANLKEVYILLTRKGEFLETHPAAQAIAGKIAENYRAFLTKEGLEKSRYWQKRS